MAEFIGSRISLISKSDIRYVGTLHEINSENSTVALEQVVSFGTEGRRPEDEVAPSDYVYAYIVFRGSDVKDLRIEETPKKDTLPKQPVPDDPAILGSTRRNTPPLTSPSVVQKPVQTQVSQPQQPQFPQQSQPPQHQQPQPTQQPNQNQQRQQPPPRYPQQPYPYYYGPPPQQRFAPQGFPAGSGFPGMPYGAPPGWYPPPGQGYHYPPPGQFYAPQPPIGSAVQQHIPPGQQGPQTQPNTGTSASATTDTKEQKPKPQMDGPQKPVATVKLPSTSTTPAPPLNAQGGPPPPPTESKPDVATALAPPAIATSKEEVSAAKPASAAPTSTVSVPTGPKSGRIMPAVPRLSPAMKPPVPVNGNLPPKQNNTTDENEKPGAKPAFSHPSQIAKKSQEDANRDARAAVEAAMAKLPPAPGPKKQGQIEGVMENLTNKVSEMRTNDNFRTSKHPGTGGYATGHRGRGANRGGRFQGEQHTNKVDVPATDYDFVSANAKFNKQDLVKEAIAAGSPIGSPVEAGHSKENSGTQSINGVREGSQPSTVIPHIPSYDKTTSFFDNISSESKDRDEGTAKRLGGREFRNEEQKKNLETFGQGSVDNGYRGGPGYRGRRGRGYGRARGGYRGGRGGIRGGSGTVTAES